MSLRYEVTIVGTGARGGTLARHLAPSGKSILLLERALRVGDHLLERLGAGRTLSSPNT